MASHCRITKSATAEAAAPHPGWGHAAAARSGCLAAAPDLELSTLDPLPSALDPAACLFRQWAIAALDKAQRRWHLAFVSHSSAAVEAVVAQGLAVSVSKHGTLPAGLRRLSAAGRLPDFPRPDIRLHAAPGLNAAGRLLPEHLVDGVR